MSNIIQLLPDSLANQIAAGEVVQRPASVVKELLENAIDADADEIELIVKEAGKQLIQVTDNGKGMSETDSRMCFERHATSKLKTTHDLFNIRTKGFRGEAMASIAAIAQVELISNQKDSDLGTCLYINGSELISSEPFVCDIGTSVLVKNLFYNVPARRKFLKSNAVEMRHIIEEFQRVALAHPEISFRLVQNDIELFLLQEANLSQRIVSVFGKGYQSQLATVEEETDHVKIHGFVGKPKAAKKTRGEQYFFANNRFIKSPYLNHAVLNAYEGLLQKGTYPFYVLFIEIDPKHIDINVHPTKTEIKFDDERTIYAIMQASIRKSIGMHNLTPSIDFDLDVNFGVNTVGKRDYEDNNSPFKNWTPPESQARQFSSSSEKGPIDSEINSQTSNNGGGNFIPGNKKKWQSLYEGFENEVLPNDRTEALKTDNSSDKELFPSENMDIVVESIFQLKAKFIVTQTKSGLLLIDQQAAHERVLFEKYLNNLTSRKGLSQQVLFPQHVDLSPSDFQLVDDLKEEIIELGFQYEEFGKNAIVLQGIPTNMSQGNEKQLFEGLIEQYKYNCNSLKLSKQQNLAQALSKRSSMKKGQKMQIEEMNGLISQLFSCENPNYTPDGRPTFVILGTETIDQYFNK